MPDSTIRLPKWLLPTLVIVFMLLLIFILFFMSEPTDFQKGLIRFFVATLAMILTATGLGGIRITGALLGYTIKAGGGIAVFILLLTVIDIFDAKTIIATDAPGLLPVDSTIVFTQKRLTDAGYYEGPITGKADSKTREAIRSFQRSNKLEVSGFLGDSTRVVLQSRRIIPFIR